MKRKIVNVFIVLMLFLGMSAAAQTTKILYIEPDGQTGPKYDKIRNELVSGLRACLQEKWVKKLPSTAWERSPSKQKLLEAMRVNYVLMLDPLPVIKGTEKNIDLTFKLIYVDNAYQPHDLIWNDALFNLGLNSSLEPIDIKGLASKVCDEIDFFINSSDDPWQRKFRPRIKIGDIKVKDNSEDLDINAFAKWLNKILDDKYSVDPKYIFYYSRKYNKQYPEESVYKITGTVSNYQAADDHLVQVELMIEFPDAHDVEPAVIHTEQFVTSSKQKDNMVNNVITVLENKINYYEKE